MSIQHVLIIDDSKTEQMFLTTLMNKHNMSCSVADSADAAMAQLEQKKT